MRTPAYLCLFSTLLCAAFGLAQNTKTTAAAKSPARTQRATTSQSKLSPQKRFVLDVVQSAVALPQPDPQDRLRVLTTATTVVGPVNAKLATQYSKEGARIESELIAGGQQPAVSILSAGHFDCTAAAPFVEQIPATAVVVAEQSLINIMSACPREATPPVRQKLETALNQGTLAARALLAAMETTGPKSAWSQTNFARMFRTLPSDPEKNRAEAVNYAAMYNRMAPEVDKDVARDAGLRLLTWLSKLNDGNEKTIAVNITSDTLKKALGNEAYEDALRSDVVVRDVVNSAAAARPGEIEHPAEENVSVLAAMGQVGTDRTEQISKMSPSLRAREAAAQGFADGTGGHVKSADRYFDIAFSAADEVWNDRNEQKNAPAVIQEVSEAAAQVNPVTALKRAQALSDPSAQAIGMLAVARVVLGNSNGSDNSGHSTPAPRSASTSNHPIR